jgi:ligand-binding sensor domain-containing protein
MKKCTQIYTLFLMFTFCASCKEQSKTDLPADNTKSETKDKAISYRPSRPSSIGGTIDEPISYGPSNLVRTIKQDRKGNIWIASWEGVFRYNGKSFTNITRGVSSARFFSLLEDRKGNFWFGSIGSGVYYYDGKSFQNFTIREGLLNNEVCSIYEDKKGNIWFGVSGGASCYDGKSFRNYIINGDTMNEDRTGKTFQDRQPNGVHFIIEDKTGNFWFGTRSNTFIYDGKKFTVLTNKDGKTFMNVWCMIEDKKGNIWLGDNSGFWRYNGSTFTNITQRSAFYIIEDKKGNIWTSSRTGPGPGQGSVLSRYEEKSLSSEMPTVTEIPIAKGLFGILEDAEGNIWFGASDGVYRYDGNTITDFKGKEGKK